MNRIGLVTVLFNSESTIEPFVDCIAKQDLNSFKLYIIDNASTDNSVELMEKAVRKAELEYDLIKNESNLGVAAANNQGIVASINDNCEYIVLLNNDIEFEADTFRNLLSIAHETGADMLAPKVSIHGTDYIWFAGGGFSFLKGINVHWHYRNQLLRKGLRRMEISYAPTCFLFCKRSVFDQIGLMDERYFVYYDDTDFMFRSQKAKLSLLYEPSVLISHKVSSSTGGELSDFSLRYINRNRIFFIGKNYSILLRLFFYCITFLSLLPKLLRMDRKKAIVVFMAINEGFDLLKEDRRNLRKSSQNKMSGK